MADNYGKRPLWQWIAIYVVAGIIVYGFIYFVFFRKGYSAPAPTGSNSGQMQGPKRIY